MPLEGSTLLTPPQHPLSNSGLLSSQNAVVLTAGQQSEPIFRRITNQSGSNAVYLVGFSFETPGVQTPEAMAEIAASSMSFSDFAAWLAFRELDAQEGE